MGKSVLFMSLVMLSVIGIGVAVVPNNMLFWLASGDQVYQQMRIAIGVIISIQLVTNPPRHIWFRLLAGGTAVVVGAWAIGQAYNYHMQLLDVLGFMGASFAVLATSLERSYGATGAYSKWVHNDGRVKA